MTESPALLVQPADGGHQAEHLLWIVRAWIDAEERRPLLVTAPPGLLEREPRLAEAIEASEGTVRAVPFPDPTRRTTGTAFSNALALHRWRPLAEVVRQERPRDVALLSFDHFLASLAARRPLPAGVRLSALTLRPTLHYDEIGSPARGLRERAARHAKRLVTAAALRHPNLTTVFTLDPTAAPALDRLGPARAVPVPDPTPPEPIAHDREAVRAELGVERGRQLAVLLGRLDERKGVLATLRALLEIPPDGAAGLCVVLWGRVHPAIETPFHELCAEVEARTRVQLVVRTDYVPVDWLSSVVAAADAVLLPYDRHVGSSGFLVRAAGAGVPVVSQDFGLMGHLVRTHRLGRTVEATDSAALARALEGVVEAPMRGFDAEAALRFAQSQTAEAFAAPFLDVLRAP